MTSYKCDAINSLVIKELPVVEPEKASSPLITVTKTQCEPIQSSSHFHNLFHYDPF